MPAVRAVDESGASVATVVARSEVVPFLMIVTVSACTHAVDPDDRSAVRTLHLTLRRGMEVDPLLDRPTGELHRALEERRGDVCGKRKFFLEPLPHRDEDDDNDNEADDRIHVYSPWIGKGQKISRNTPL